MPVRGTSLNCGPPCAERLREQKSSVMSIAVFFIFF